MIDLGTTRKYSDFQEKRDITKKNDLKKISILFTRNVHVLVDHYLLHFIIAPSLTDHLIRVMIMEVHGNVIIIS
jgi:hypothetical protein